MDVHLLVYDLSNGMAKQMSLGLLGFQLDAIYHTSIELEGMEYVYDSGINVIRPGTSHLGPPLQRLHLGKTELPMEVILEYLDSLREIYTPQAYDLFRHNCNNFSNDFSTFLIGKGIPDHISNMPQAVLDSPFGRMLQPQLTQMVEQRKAQQGGLLGIQNNVQPHTNGASAAAGSQSATVKVVSNLQELNKVLDSAKNSCAIIFFTMATCPPCKAIYPLYDSLAAEHGNKVTLIKVDTSKAFDVGSKYSISATPTFITFVRGEQGERWMGADPSRLRGTVGLLAQMAVPSHPHRLLRLPQLANTELKPILYTKVPPLPKLLSKLGPKAEDASIQGVKHFIETRSSDGPAQTTLPDLNSFAIFLRSAVTNLPREVLFTVVDLFRCALVDPRLSGYFAEEHGHKTVITLLNAVNEEVGCPYALRLVALHMACNLFSSHLYADQILSHGPLRSAITQLISSSFLDDGHNNVRVAAASLLFNIATANYQKRQASGDALAEEDQIELAASVLEAISQEESSSKALQGMLLALGFLAYCMPLDGELVDLLRSMDAQGTVIGKKKQFPDESLVTEIGIYGVPSSIYPYHQERTNDLIDGICETLTGMLEPPLLSPTTTISTSTVIKKRTGEVEKMRNSGLLRSTASTPSMRSRDGMLPPHMMRMDNGGNVRVVVRVRAFLPREIERGAECLISMDPMTQMTTLHVPNDSDPANARAKTRKVIEEKSFTFDNSFWSHDTRDAHYAHQEDVYDSLGEEFLDHNFDGYHTCIFAYGQTGSGKSYTMMGTPDQPGLIPRTCEDLFQRIEAAQEETPNISYHVRASYFEVYNEHVRDLLVPVVPNQAPYYLKIRESPTEGPYVKDLTEVPVRNLNEILRYMQSGDASRTTASTKMNDTSSRSHAVFTIMLKQIHHDMETDETTERSSRIRLVDLAGSERAKSTEATGARLREGSNINKSLTTLGRVIAALADAPKQRPGKRGRDIVPYRDSILTWLLKDSLGGNSKTAMIACIAPSDYEETLSTLRYADQAKRIRTRAVVNQDHISTAERDAQIAAMAEEIRALQLSVSETRRREREDARDSEERLEEYQNRVAAMQRMMEERSLVAEGKIRSLQTENEALRLHLKLALDSLKNPIPEVVVKEKDLDDLEADKENVEANDKEKSKRRESLVDEAYYGEDDGYESEVYEEKANDVQDYMHDLLEDLALFRRKIGDDKGRFLDDGSRHPLGVQVNA
ncbi:P-loop containing nucleoside triphosphate hydrolase protein [Hypoxylon trugodes]|uniref:P-loop containing nucleoside triphosphate hydrolase protein n=1 Tax=Hypoxylon trugodes TaxID=326681 RepID=UPI0021997664|nr:P-loop containing nucleoside triphosphate hydrolase protein [Hypoxylon trugodes]KAI1391532.1 P-loop containing nucleoside triphosphate hydrolase protein [Hypoxylon trugodes]